MNQHCLVLKHFSDDNHSAVINSPEISATVTQDYLVDLKFSVVHSDHGVTKLLIQAELIIHQTISFHFCSSVWNFHFSWLLEQLLSLQWAGGEWMHSHITERLLNIKQKWAKLPCYSLNNAHLHAFVQCSFTTAVCVEGAKFVFYTTVNLHIENTALNHILYTIKSYNINIARSSVD